MTVTEGINSVHRKWIGECPVCYGETEEEEYYEYSPAYHEAHTACKHKCFYEEAWCGNYRVSVIIRGHCIEFVWSYDEDYIDRLNRQETIEIVIKAARKALIEDLRNAQQVASTSDSTTQTDAVS